MSCYLIIAAKEYIKIHGHCNIPLSATIFECILPSEESKGTNTNTATNTIDIETHSTEAMIVTSNTTAITTSTTTAITTNNNNTGTTSNNNNTSATDNDSSTQLSSVAVAVETKSNKNKKQKVPSTTTVPPTPAITSTTTNRPIQEKSKLHNIQGEQFYGNLSVWIFCQRLSHMKILTSRNSAMFLTLEQETLLQQLVNDGRYIFVYDYICNSIIV